MMFSSRKCFNKSFWSIIIKKHSLRDSSTDSVYRMMLHSILMLRNCYYLWQWASLIQISHSPPHSHFLFRNRKYHITSSLRSARTLFETIVIRLQLIFQIKVKTLLYPFLLCFLAINCNYAINTSFKTFKPRSIDQNEVMHTSGEKISQMRPKNGCSHLISSLFR